MKHHSKCTKKENSMGYDEYIKKQEESSVRFTHGCPKMEHRNYSVGNVI